MQREVKVIKALPGNRAIVCTRGLRAVVLSDGDTLQDLIPTDEAKNLRDFWNGLNKQNRARVVKYRA